MDPYTEFQIEIALRFGLYVTRNKARNRFLAMLYGARPAIWLSL